MRAGSHGPFPSAEGIRPHDDRGCASETNTRPLDPHTVTHIRGLCVLIMARLSLVVTALACAATHNVCHRPVLLGIRTVT